MKGSSRAILAALTAVITASCATVRSEPPLLLIVEKEVVDPPPAAYLAVLDSVAARLRPVLATRRVFVDAAGLPEGIGLEELRARGFLPVDASYRCGRDAQISLAEPPQYENGRYQLATAEWLSPERWATSYDHVYHVECAGDSCWVAESLLAPADRRGTCSALPPG